MGRILSKTAQVDIDPFAETRGVSSEERGGPRLKKRGVDTKVDSRQRPNRNRFEKDLTKDVLGSLIRADRKTSDGRLSRTSVGLALTERYKKDQFEMLDKYRLGQQWPTAKTAWHLGEALHDAGIPWASGLWMTWALCRFGDAVSIIADWAHQHRDELTGDDFQAVWQVAAHARDMASGTDLDTVDPFATHHIRETAFTEDADRALARWFKENAREHAATYSRYLMRAKSKEAAAPYERIRDSLNATFANWSRTAKLPVATDLDRFLGSLIKISDARTVPPLQREIGVLAMFGQWLNSIEHGNVLLLPRPTGDAARFSRSIERIVSESVHGVDQR